MTNVRVSLDIFPYIINTSSMLCSQPAGTGPAVLSSLCSPPSSAVCESRCVSTGGARFDSSRSPRALGCVCSSRVAVHICSRSILSTRRARRGWSNARSIRVLGCLCLFAVPREVRDIDFLLLGGPVNFQCVLGSVQLSARVARLLARLLAGVGQLSAMAKRVVRKRLVFRLH